MCSEPPNPLPADDGTRAPTRVDPDAPGLTHIAVVGDTYTYLIEGRDTNGRYALIDMLIPAGGGPPPHRHDFEEMFHVLDGLMEVTVRAETEEFFAEFGDELASRTAPAPQLTDSEQQARMEKARAAAPRYGIENL
jgi:mannose-6-phosphate isomerase-like protein (cupin superfamily)